MFVFIHIMIKGLDDYFKDWYLFCCSFEQHGRSVFFTWLWTVLVENFYVCKFDFNDSFTVLTIIVRKQYILQHQSSQKYWIVQSHPNYYLKLFDNSFHGNILYQEYTVSENWISWLIISYAVLISCETAIHSCWWWPVTAIMFVISPTKLSGAETYIQ